MSVLEKTVDVVGQWGNDRAADRDKCVELLQKLSSNMEQAATVWEDIGNNAPADGHKFTRILWAGNERSRKLHQLHLDSIETAAALTELTGVAAKDTLGIMDELDVVDAYREMSVDESPADWVKGSLDILAKRREGIAGTVGKLQ